MKRRNATRSALFTSIISLLLCVSMLVGTTFAWFTDEVVSGNNVIAAGNLNVELYNSIGIDESKKVSNTTPLFEEVTLWEPGVVAYENLTVANVGTLALQYQLTMNITGENTVKDTNYKLSDVLKIAVVEGGIEGATREAVLQEVADSGASWETLKTKALSGQLTADTADTVGLVIYWQPTANDNNWNLNNGKTTSNGAETLQITLGINLFATQLQHEKDSFDETYDKDAALEIPEIKVETPTADALLAALKAGETAVLTSDLTLDGDGVIPADKTSAIDLNGHTLTVGNNEVAVEGNLIVTATNGGSIVVEATGDESADLYAPFFVQNGGHLVIESGKIVVNSGAGVILYGDADFTMTGGSITANNGTNAVMAVSTDSDIELLGGTITATEPGYVMNLQDCDTNVVLNGTTLNGTIAQLGGDLVLTYYGDTAPEIVEDTTQYTQIVRKGTAYEGITQNPSNTKQYYIESKAGLMNLNALLAAVAPNEANIITVDLTTDVNLAGEDWAPINSMWVTFNGNGHTISNINAGLSTDGRRSGFWGYAGVVTINELTLENVTVSGSQAGIFAGSAEGLKVNNCYLKGDNTVNFVAGVETWNGIGAITGVLVTSDVNVEIVSGATVNLNTNGMTTDPGCTYVDDLTGYIQANKGTVTNNGTIIKGISTAAELLAYSAKALTGDNGKAESATLALLNDIDMAGAEFSAMIAQRGDTLNFLGNGHTISNVKLVSGANDNTTGQASMFYAFPNSTLNVSDLILQDITVTADKNATGYAAAVIGYCEGAVVLNNVDVVTASVTGAKSSGILAGHVGNGGTLTATDCDINGTVTLTNYETNGHYAGKYVGTIDGNTALTNCTAKVTLGGELHVNNVGGIFGRKVSGNLTIDGAECVADGLTKNGVVYFVYNANGLETLNKKMADQSAGRDVVVNLTADIDFAGKTWTTVDSFADTAFEIAEINGNGHTISNLTINGQAMFRRFAGSGNVVIKDITFDKATVNSNGNINTSILTVQSYQNVLLDNVDVKNSSITGGYKVAPLIATVYNESSSTITATLKNCDVENVEVTATSYDFCTTGMVAFVNAGDNDQIEFENCTVTNVKLYAPNVYTAHAAVYTTGSETLFNEVEGVTVTNVTFENK